MTNTIPSVPEPRNEPVLSYAPGTPERRALAAELETMAGEVIEIAPRIDGRPVATGKTAEAVMPHDHRHALAVWHKAGAKEVHLRVSCPPTRHPCYYGIDFPDPKDLIAARMDVESIRGHLELDSLGYLSLEGMLSATSKGPENYCTACWSG